ncbi:hypothetical protein IJS77_01195 [bacterium]|nr:hypothetical protein [bacterium]
MKINNIQNSRTFKGLNIGKVNSPDRQRVIIPCIEKLRALSKKADIEISSSNIMQEFEHFKSPRPALNISVKPLDNIKAKIASANYTMIIDNESIRKKTLLRLIKKAVRFMF